ncbi:MAG: diadenylate cyclase CdaA [Oscillospiraceae bacterium]|nr:diadenylate cyclase CdaA [Oscillospiraceae bacterium]
MADMFKTMADFFLNVFHSISNVVQSVHVIDLIDIALLTYLVYMAMRFIRESRAVQLMKGILVLVAVYVVSGLGLKSIHFITQQVLGVGVLAVVILFQPELRRVLEKFGNTAFHTSLFAESSRGSWEKAIPIICESVADLAKNNTGALIVIERNTKLGEQISGGTVLNALPSLQLFGNIFYPKTPLHDGAVIMRDGLIVAAACFLPRPQKDEGIDKRLGTRHRAAIGMSENSDAIIIVVSEETGQISVAENGKITRDYNGPSLQQLLRNALIPAEEEQTREDFLAGIPFFGKHSRKSKQSEKEGKQ